VIVNGSSAAGQDALSQVQNYLTSAAPSPELRDDFVDVFDGGFRDFAKPQYLANLVQGIRSTVNAASRRH
jgi:hypothetical protein